MTAINLPFAQNGPRRIPNGDELNQGHPCGPLDRDLANWLEWWPLGQIAAAIDAAGLTVDDSLLLRLAQAIQSGKSTYAVATGTANAWVVAPNLAVPAYAAGRVLNIIAPATNTSTTVNMNVSGLGNRRIKKSDGTDPAVGDLAIGNSYPTIDDGTNVRVLSPLPSQIKSASFKRSRVIFTTPGSISWTVPDGVGAIRILAWGAGAGGGFGANPSGPSGGGAGAYYEWTAPVSGGDAVTGTVGAGGAAGFSGGNGAAGGASSVTVNGQTRTAGGGAGGINATSNNVTNSSVGGVVSGGATDVARPGGASSGGLTGYSGGILFYAGSGGDAPNGGYGGLMTVGPGGNGLTPGGGGGGGGNGNPAGAGAAGEIWIEY